MLYFNPPFGTEIRDHVVAIPRDRPVYVEVFSVPNYQARVIHEWLTAEGFAPVWGTQLGFVIRFGQPI